MAMTDTGLFSGTADSATSGPQSSATGSPTLFTTTVDFPATERSGTALLENAAHAWAQLADEALLRGDQDTALDMISWAYRAAERRTTRA